jgi:GntR family transcriptional repressor for pyruvate dehydrogenase complex
MDTVKSLPVKPIQRRSIPEAIIHELKSLIDSGHIAQGSKLPGERELAKMLNVSRPSLREALRALILLGILDNRQGDGTYLTSSNQWPIEPFSIMLSVKKGALLDIFEARESIENTSAGLAAFRRDEEDLKEMEKALESMRLNFDNPDEYIKYDLNFHKAIILATKNPVFEDLMEKIYHLIMNTSDNNRTYPSELYKEKNYRQHEIIYKYIKAADKQMATKAMADHMRHIKQRLMAARRSA